MTLIEFLNDIYTRVCRSEKDDLLITVERDLNDDKWSVYFASRLIDMASYGTYKTNIDGTCINQPNPFALSFSGTLIDTLKMLNDDADKPHIESHVKFVDDYVYDPSHNKKGKHFGISVDMKDKKVGVSTRMFHNCHGSSFACIVKGVQDRIVPRFSSVDFSVKFSSEEVKKIVKHLDEKTIIDFETWPKHENVIYFRRNSKGKLFLEVRDVHHSYSVHTDHDIEEDLLYIPIRIRIHQFIYILKTCLKNNRGVIIAGKVFSTEDQTSYLKMIDEDDFARYEYLIPYLDKGINSDC